MKTTNALRLIGLAASVVLWTGACGGIDGNPRSLRLRSRFAIGAEAFPALGERRAVALMLQYTDAPPYWGPRAAALRDPAVPPQNPPVRGSPRPLRCAEAFTARLGAASLFGAGSNGASKRTPGPRLIVLWAT